MKTTFQLLCLTFFFAWASGAQESCSHLRAEILPLGQYIKDAHAQRPLILQARNQFELWKHKLLTCPSVEQVALHVEAHTYLATALVDSIKLAGIDCYTQKNPVVIGDLLSLWDWMITAPEFFIHIDMLGRAIEKCANFEIEFEGEVQVQGAEIKYNYAAEAKVPLKGVLLGKDLNLEGTGELAIHTANTVVPHCSISITTTPGELSTYNLNLDWPNLHSIAQIAPSLQIDFQFFSPQESNVFNCPPAPPWNAESQNWMSFISVLYSLNNSAGPYSFNEFTGGSGSAIAEYKGEHSHQTEEAVFTEKTKIRLLHTPQI